MKKVLFPLLTLLFYSYLPAQIVQETGSVSYPYKPSGFTGKPKKEDIDAAIKAAKLNALDRFMATRDANTFANFNKIKASVEADINSVVPNASLLRNDYDKRQKLIFITLRAGINYSLIENLLIAVGPAKQTPSGELSNICAAFVARRQTDRTISDQTRTLVDRKDKSSEEFEEVASDGIRTTIVADQRIENSSVSGGTTTIKAEVIEWDIFTSESISTVMSGVLSNAGYELIQAADIDGEADGISIDALNADYSRGQDLAPSTRSRLIKGCKEVGLDYLAIGTLNVEAPLEDPISGQTRVTVSVNAKVIDLTTRFPKTKGGVVEQYSAIGLSQTTAELSAIELASEDVAKKIAAALQNKSIK